MTQGYTKLEGLIAAPLYHFLPAPLDAGACPGPRIKYGAGFDTGSSPA